MMKSRFPHHKALVTGASSGLGRELCGLLAETGCEIWGVSRDASRVPQTCAHAVALDLADAMVVAHFSEGMLKEIAPDLLVNCAGGGVFGDTAAIDADTFAAELRVLLESPALICRAALPAMLAAERGCIANVSSMAAEFPLPCMAPYNAAKAGLSALSRTLAEETRGMGVAVIDFRPGDFSSGFLASTRRLGGSQKAWEAASAHIRGAPSAGKIAADLFEAIARGRSGTVRSGGFFQTRLAPFGARVLPSWAMERLARKYLG